MDRKGLGLREVIVFVLVIVVALLWYFYMRPGEEVGTQARISRTGYGDVYVMLGVDNPRLELAHVPYVVFGVEDGFIAFVESDCPDQVCIHMGRLSRVGQSAACLPNRVSVVIIGEVDDEIDVFV